MNCIGKYKMKINSIILIILTFLSFPCSGQNEDSTQQSEPVKNVILMIGDGMGLSQIYAAYTVNRGNLNMERAQAVGLSKTYSADKYVTDSGAGGTAISCGVKTRNEMIGMDTSAIKVRTLLEIAEDAGLSTGLVVTSSILHATPASFIAHQINRHNYREIAADFLDSGIDIFVGGGRLIFEDSTDIAAKLKEKGYSIVHTLDSIDINSSMNIGCLAADSGLIRMTEGRGNYLPDATRIALSKLSKNKNGFFIMVEGSQIDWGGHDNNIDYLIEEVIDFDHAVGEAFDFADRHPGTLVVVTADHETGGLSIIDGDLAKGEIITSFSTDDHSGVMVPVLAYGRGAAEFTGIYENTAIFHKIMALLSFNE
jgi:alkaline phosphatase